MKDVMKPSMYGVGVLGGVVSNEERSSKVYTSWSNMLKRCYSVKESAQRSSYEGCCVSNNFSNYQYFKNWYNNQIGHDRDGWNLDKDLLVKGNKVYSESTCVFIPQDINLLLTKCTASRGEYLIGVCWHKRDNTFVAMVNKNKGKSEHLGYFKTELEAYNAYKVAKEAFVKEQANKWKGKIDLRAYEALMNYTVEITD